jgi:hypothetical protein
MKKLIVILLFAGLTLAGYSQVRTLSTRLLKAEQTFFSYTGVAADSLSVFQDTIQMQITVNKNYPYAVSLRSAFDTIDGADTLVYINVLGKVYEDDSWSSIIADSSAAVSAAANKTVTNWTGNIYTITADTTAISVDSVGYYSYNVIRASAVADNYRYLLIRYIIAGDDSVGKGVLLKKLELNLIRKE